MLMMDSDLRTSDFCVVLDGAAQAECEILSQHTLFKQDLCNFPSVKKMDICARLVLPLKPLGLWCAGPWVKNLWLNLWWTQDQAIA